MFATTFFGIHIKEGNKFMAWCLILFISYFFFLHVFFISISIRSDRMRESLSRLMSREMICDFYMCLLNKFPVFLFLFCLFVPAFFRKTLWDLRKVFYPFVFIIVALRSTCFEKPPYIEKVFKGGLLWWQFKKLVPGSREKFKAS